MRVEPISSIFQMQRRSHRPPDATPKAYRVELSSGRGSVGFNAGNDSLAIAWVAREYRVRDRNNPAEWIAAGVTAIYKNPNTKIWPKQPH